MPAPILTVNQMRQWEQATWAEGKREEDVIRQVGEILAGHARGMTRSGDRILILGGKGHNGDDARCAEPHLFRRRVEVLRVTDPDRDGDRVDGALARRPALVIDGLFGIGLNRPLSEGWSDLIERVNASRRPVLAVDGPSGLSAETGEPLPDAVRARVTLTLGAPKTGLLKSSAWPYVGELRVAPDIGLSPRRPESPLQFSLSEDFTDYPPARAVDGHKGSFGHTVILAGSLGYHGAALLASRAALRARPGLVTVFTHEPAFLPVACQSAAAMIHPWRNSIPSLPGNGSAILVGPGLAAADLPETARNTIADWWRAAQLPVVADASALEWLPTGRPDSEGIRVITPHPGEAARLLGRTTREVQMDRPGALKQLARRYPGTWVVLKGHQTCIGNDSENIFVNGSGSPSLGQGGSGDILAGFLAGLLSQPALQADPSRTIRYAVWEHGAAANRLDRRSPGWTIADLIPELGSRGSRRSSRPDPF